MAEHRIFNFPDKYMCDLVSHQSLNVASDRGDKPGTTPICFGLLASSARGVAPGLPPLIQPFPTLRRDGAAAACERLRRNSNRFFAT